MKCQLCGACVRRIHEKGSPEICGLCATHPARSLDLLCKKIRVLQEQIDSINCAKEYE